MRKIIGALIVVVIISCAAFTFGQERKGKGGTAKITLYGSNGAVISEWTSVYEVKYENGQFLFYDSKTDHLIGITGTVVVDKAP